MLTSWPKFIGRMGVVTLHDKSFKPYIDAGDIRKAIALLAEKITSDLKEANPVFLGVLNGSFVFIADLMRMLPFACEISFVKLQSYAGTSSTGKVSELIGVSSELVGRTIVVVEDIVDTGETLEKLLESLEKMQPKEVKVATLLHKPTAYKKQFKLDYVAIEIPNEFVVGYGLDYDGLGRNLKDIYKIVE